VNTEEVARPLASVTSVSVAVEFDANVPLAPDAGAVNVTDTPLTGSEPASTTNATSGNANAVLNTAYCGLPLDTESVVAAPAVFVRLKLAGCDTPESVAVTV
jgi:hypothetical protein